MIEPLLEICAKRVANYIYDGELEHLDWKLDEKLSNIVFKHFYEMDRKITGEAADEISNKLKVTKMILDRKDFYEIHRKMVFAQDLEQLQLEKPGSRVMFNQFNLVTDEKYDIKELPNIGNLELIVDHMHQTDFTDLCNCFKNITKLELWSFDVTELNGISKLENLEFLNISGVDFEGKEDCMDIFKLKKLKVLDISGVYVDRGRTENISFYLKCDKYLPELRYIDCSFNKINLEMLEKLVDTHPKLEMISLIGTPINKTSQLKNKNVKLLTEENLKCCMESLNHFSKTDNHVTTEGIIGSIRAIIFENYKQQTESDLHKLFNQLIHIAPTDMKISHKSIQCLEDLSRGERMLMFDINERQSLIKMLLFFSQKRFHQTKVQNRFYESLWSVLNNDILLNTKTENSNEICERAAIMMVEGEEYGEVVFNDCLQIMTKSMEQMKSERFLKLAKNWKLTKRLLRMMNSFDEYDVNFRLLLNLIFELYSKFPTRSIPRSREYINTLMKNVKDYTENTIIQSEILIDLEEIVVQMNPIAYNAFFTEENYTIILTLLSKNSTKESALYLLVTLYYCTEEGKAENLEQLKEERVEDILKIIGKNDAVNDSDKFAMFQSIISTSESEETISWAKWILSHFEEFQEPRLKRRRMQ